MFCIGLRLCFSACFMCVFSLLGVRVCAFLLSFRDYLNVDVVYVPPPSRAFAAAVCLSVLLVVCVLEFFFSLGLAWLGLAFSRVLVLDEAFTPHNPTQSKPKPTQTNSTITSFRCHSDRAGQAEQAAAPRAVQQPSRR